MRARPLPRTAFLRTAFLRTAFLLVGLAPAAPAALADPAPFLVEDGTSRYSLAPPVSVPEPPDLVDRALADAVRAWAAVRALAGEAEAAIAPVLDELATQADAAAVTVERVSAPALAEAGRLGVEVRDAAGDLARHLHAETAELREHPVVQAAADVGVLLRVVEAIGIGALVGGLAWKKLRGA